MYEPIVDLYQVFKDKVVFGLVDGTVGCDSIRPAGPYYGPTEGRAVKLDMLVAGRDAVAVDAVSERIAGLNPFDIKLTKLAHDRGLGQIEDIRTVGDRIGFAPLSQSLLGTFFNLLIPIMFTGTRISRFLNPLTTPLMKRLFGPSVRTLHSVERDLKNTKVGSILLAGDCDGCGLCVKACKMNNIKLQRGTPVIGKDHCVRCLICVEICPKGALALSRV